MSPSFLQTLSLAGHLRTIFLSFHPLADFIQFREVLSLLIPQALELSLDLFLFSQILRHPKRIFGFLELLVQVTLPASEILEPTQDLDLLTLLVVLQATGLTLGFVTIVFLLEV